MTSKEIRKAFLDFFRSKGHEIVPSAPMVIKNDPTLMFTNAGMNPFKDIFLGNDPVKYKRIADTQKCLRVSGKHNDLEEVGHDTYHHTMFEMLGNWSFGDYFKKEAIDWAWELLVDVYKLPKDRLYATIFEGDAEDKTERDNEAYELWKKYLPESHILTGNKRDNFWEMGATGPCGPCSEIHVDLRSDAERAKIDGATLVNESDPLVVEIWNLVFMQFNRKADKSLELLPAKHVDTGMGFERLCMAIQGKQSNYDTDIFKPLIDKLAHMCGKTYSQNKEADVAMRVIADHIRAVSFSIADGQLPSNTKAGYIIRRILRRAVRYGYTFLGFNKPFMHSLVSVLVAEMGEAFPELVLQQTQIENVVREEETSFFRTMATGITMLDKIMSDIKTKGSDTIPSKEAFVLYDTYGFPFDLTALILAENGMKADEKGFEAEMQQQKDRARNAATIETEDWIIVSEGEQQFVGYDNDNNDVNILRYRKVKQKNKEFYQLVLDNTPFYAESGGQVGDSGQLINDTEKVDIFDTKKENNLTVHLVNKLPTDVTAGFTANINSKKRRATECNHSATHLLHEALREVLGTHVEQRGSYVSPEVLRFDFSHFQKLTDEEIRAVEKKVTAKIRENIALNEMRAVPVDKAKSMGAMALFGEKYGDSVRVIQFGKSVELCGGTHTSHTGNIGTFRIISEGSIASGIRRIEAITAETCEDYIYMFQDLVQDFRLMFNNTPNIKQALHKFFDENAELKKVVEEFRKEKIHTFKNKLKESGKEINGVKVYTLKGNFNAEDVKDIAFQMRGDTVQSMFFVGATEMNGKPTITLMLSDDLVARGLNASNIIRTAAKHIEGGGGGQGHFATAGGKNADGLTMALEEIMKVVNEL